MALSLMSSKLLCFYPIWASELASSITKLLNLIRFTGSGFGHLLILHYVALHLVVVQLLDLLRAHGIASRSCKEFALRCSTC